MKPLCAIAAIAASAALTAGAQNPPPVCRAPTQVEAIASLHALATPIRNALLQRVPDLVDADQPFDATDVVMHGAHFNRFAFAWHANGRWVVATERGGIAYSNPVYTIVWNQPTTRDTSLPIDPALIANASSSRAASLCSTVERALRDPLTPAAPVKPQGITHG